MKNYSEVRKIEGKKTPWYVVYIHIIRHGICVADIHTGLRLRLHKMMSDSAHCNFLQMKFNLFVEVDLRLSS